jgi:hypothetical protein
VKWRVISNPGVSRTNSARGLAHSKLANFPDASSSAQRRGVRQSSAAVESGVEPYWAASEKDRLMTNRHGLAPEVEASAKKRRSQYLYGVKELISYVRTHLISELTAEKPRGASVQGGSQSRLEFRFCGNDGGSPTAT